MSHFKVIYKTDFFASGSLIYSKTILLETKYLTAHEYGNFKLSSTNIDVSRIYITLMPASTVAKGTSPTFTEGLDWIPEILLSNQEVLNFWLKDTERAKGKGYSLLSWIAAIQILKYLLMEGNVKVSSYRSTVNLFLHFFSIYLLQHTVGL